MRRVADTDWAAEEPMGRTVMSMGDFNLPEASTRIDYATPEGGRRITEGGQYRRERHPVWGLMAEISDSAPSHFASGSSPSTRQDILVDAHLVALWARVAHIRSYRADGDPQRRSVGSLTGRGRDRAEGHAGSSGEAGRPAHTRDKRFAALLQKTLEMWDFADWDVEDRVSLYGVADRSAAKVVRDRRRWEQVGELAGPVVAAARAVAMQHPQEARCLLESHPQVSKWIVLEGGQVQLRVPARFEADRRRRRIADLDGAIRAEGGEAASRGSPSQCMGPSGCP